MIAFVRGKVHSYDSDSVILDNGGIGYQVYFNLKGPLALGEEITLFTHQQFLQDGGQYLYGFLRREELDLFERLISVKGLGCRTAMKMMAADSYDRIVSAIEASDTAYLRKLPGIGKSTASQIVLDLKGKLVHPENKAEEDPELQDAIAAMKSLGYRAQEIAGIREALRSSGAKSSAEYLRLGLQFMQERKQ